MNSNFKIYKWRVFYKKNVWWNFSLSLDLIPNVDLSSTIYRGNIEKGSDDIGSAVCYTIYTVYLSLCKQTAESNPFREFPCKCLVLF